VSARPRFRPLRHVLSAFTSARLRPISDFATREARMGHIDRALTSGWRLSLERDRRGRTFVRLDHGRLFRLRERVEVTGAEFGHYQSRRPLHRVAA
jgi:hypothetical protein